MNLPRRHRLTRLNSFAGGDFGVRGGGWSRCSAGGVAEAAGEGPTLEGENQQTRTSTQGLEREGPGV